jgi:hypothetical protein
VGTAVRSMTQSATKITNRSTPECFKQPVQVANTTYVGINETLRLHTSLSSPILLAPLNNRPVTAQSIERLGYGLDDRGSRVRFPVGALGISLFTTASRTALGSTKPPIQSVPGAISLEVNRPVREADHSLHLVPRSKNE